MKRTFYATDEEVQQLTLLLRQEEAQLWNAACKLTDSKLSDREKHRVQQELLEMHAVYKAVADAQKSAIAASWTEHQTMDAKESLRWSQTESRRRHWNGLCDSANSNRDIYGLLRILLDMFQDLVDRLAPPEPLWPEVQAELREAMSQTQSKG